MEHVGERGSNLPCGVTQAMIDGQRGEFDIPDEDISEDDIANLDVEGTLQAIYKHTKNACAGCDSYSRCNYGCGTGAMLRHLELLGARLREEGLM